MNCKEVEKKTLKALKEKPTAQTLERLEKAVELS